MAGGTPANPATLARTSRETSLRPFMSLAHHLIKERSSRGGCVETCDVALDGKAYPHIAPFLYQPMNALAFAADDEAHRLCHVELPGERLAPRVEGDTPDVRPLDLRDRRRHPRDVSDTQQLAGARAGL